MVMKGLLFVFIIGIVSSCVDAPADEPVVVNKETAAQSHVFKVPEVPKSIYFAGVIIDLTDTDIMERFDRELVVNNFWHSNTILYMKRANRWFPLIRKVLRRNGIPEDLAYLSVIESGLTQATSPSGAKGFWQFMPRTARDYDLIINNQVDERMNIEKSTQAACEYLQKAYDQFGSWMLAAASYNRGRKGISDALEDQKVSSYFDLSLNSETSRYIFRMLAVKHIMESPEKFGFVLSEDQLYDKYECKSIKVDYKINNLSEWAVEQGTSLKVIRKLNPWILKDELFSNEQNSFKILIPVNSEQLGLYIG